MLGKSVKVHHSIKDNVGVGDIMGALGGKSERYKAIEKDNSVFILADGVPIEEIDKVEDVISTFDMKKFDKGMSNKKHWRQMKSGGFVINYDPDLEDRLDDLDEFIKTKTSDEFIIISYVGELYVTTDKRLIVE